MERSAQVIACCLALSAHAVAIVAGLGAGNDPTTVLARALIALLAGYAIGQIIAGALTHVAREHVARYQGSHPIPDLERIENAARRERVMEVE